MTNLAKKKQFGFSIVELTVVIIVLAILSAVALVSYTSLQKRANDISVQSNIDSIEGIIENYGLKNSLETAHYYSGNPADVTALGYTPSGDNVIDVVTNRNDYCIRGYNKRGTKKSIYNAHIKESSPSICTELTPSTSATIVYSGDNVWTQVSSNYYHTCAIDAYAKAYCWGLNDFGQLGNGTTGGSSNLPVAVDSNGVLAGKRIKSITTGFWHTCVVASDDLPYCWGAGSYGQLGNTSTATSNVPVAVKTSGSLSGKTIKKLVSSWTRVCVLASDNYEYCWGNGDKGSLGWSGWTSGYSSEPAPVYMGGVLLGKTVQDIITPGSEHTCLIASDNKLYCWGFNYFGQLGDNTTIDKSVPVAVNTSGLLKDKRIKSVSTNRDSTCAIASDNKAYCWGLNDVGLLGDNTVIEKHLPVAVDTSGVLAGKNLIKFTPSFYDSICAYSDDLDFYCWGYNANYQLADGTNTNRLYPVLAASTNGINTRNLSVGAYGDCAITDTYSLYCWGDGTNGRIGAGNNSSSSTPVLVNPVN